MIKNKNILMLIIIKKCKKKKITIEVSLSHYSAHGRAFSNESKKI
jgi:hypothetical protein